MKRFLAALALIPTACSAPLLEASSLIGRPTGGGDADPALALKADREPFTLAGTGSATSEGFRLAGGSTIFRLAAPASESCSVLLLDTEGKTTPWLLFTTTGQVSETRLLGLRTGSYRFDVTSQGTWSIRVEQPRDEDALPLETLSGMGDGLFGPFRLHEQPTTLSLTHSGDAGFVVDLLNPSGYLSEHVAQATGSLQSSKALTSESGIYFVSVSADGPWNLRRE